MFNLKSPEGPLSYELARASLKSCSHSPATKSAENRSRASIALSPSRQRKLSSPINRPRATANASRSRFGTIRPSISWRIMSRGPVSQSKLTAGTPCTIVSRSVLGKPSYREVMTNKSEALYQSTIFPARPGNKALSMSPADRIGVLLPQFEQLVDSAIRELQVP